MLETLRLALPLVALLAWLALAAPSKAEEPADFDALWDFGDPAGTEARFRALLPKAEASGNADRRLQLLTQIARTYSLRGRFDEAHRVLDDVERGLGPTTTTARVRYHLERGRSFNSAKRLDEAKKEFLAAWDLARKSKLDGHAVDAGHMMAIAETGDASLRWNEDMLVFVEASSDPAAKRWAGSLYNNLGWTYHDRGDFERALALFRKDLAFRLERKAAGPARIAKWSVGRALRSLGRLDEALATQRELEAEHRAAGGEDGYVYEELGECLLALKKPDEAKPWFAKAHALLSKDPGVAGDPKRVERLRTLGGRE